MGISKLDNDLIVYKGIRGWDYEGGIVQGVKVNGGWGDAVESITGGSLMDFGDYSTYYSTAYSVPIITVTESYQGETTIYFEKTANYDVGHFVAKDNALQVIADFGQVSIAPIKVANLCNGGEADISTVNVTLGICSYYNGVDYTVMPSLVCPITTEASPYASYTHFYCNGYFTSWFDDAMDFWTDGDYYDPEAEFDPENEGGGEGLPAGGAGGGGGIGIRSHHGMSVPNVPSFSGATTGMLSVYACTPAQLQGVANKLWDNSGGTDWTDTLVKNYISPFENIIGMSLLPFEPSSHIAGTSANVKIGNYDTGVSATKLSNTFCQIDLGSVNAPEAYKTFADYEGTKVDIYLPFIGVQSLNTDDVIDSTIHCVYNIDILSGVCVAFLESDKLGVFATYAGNCKADLPVSGASYSSQSVAWASNNFGAGGWAGTLSKNILVKRAKADREEEHALDIANKVNKKWYDLTGESTEKPQYARSGSIGSAGALMGIKTPFLIFSTPRVWASGIKATKGYVSNLYVKIGNESGFISSTVSNNQLASISCTDNEKEEIRNLLSQGIYI